MGCLEKNRVLLEEIPVKTLSRSHLTSYKTQRFIDEFHCLLPATKQTRSIDREEILIVTVVCLLVYFVESDSYFSFVRLLPRTPQLSNES